VVKTKREIRRLAKRALAATLFILLLIGGGAAAFTALAAGISALSDAVIVNRPLALTTMAPDSSKVVQVPLSPTPTSASTYNGSSMPPTNSASANPAPTSADNSNMVNNPVLETPYSTTTGTVTAADQWNYDLTHMHSPVGEAVDNGGFVLGQKVQQVFGGLLGGLLQTLFLEQSDTPQTGATTR